MIPLACALSLGALLGQKAGSEAADQTVFRAICGTCHSTTLVDGLRTTEEWQQEVDHMIKIGARGSEAQLQSVMRLLARTLTKININTAEPSELALVLDISTAVAEELVRRRTTNGPFKTLEELKQIPGFDPVKLESRKDRVLF